jgi:hypothetical protein
MTWIRQIKEPFFTNGLSDGVKELFLVDFREITLEYKSMEALFSEH